MDQVALYSLVFAKEEVVGFAIYSFSLAQGQEVQALGQMHITH
jgi:hypothetical protein